MTIWPNYTATKIRGVEPGMIVLVQVDNRLRPCLIIGPGKDGRDNKFVMQLFDRFHIFNMDDYTKPPAVVVIPENEWRFSLVNKLTPRLEDHTEDTPPGKLLLHSRGRFIAARAVDSQTRMESSVAVNLDANYIVDYADSFDGRNCFVFDWVIEIRLSHNEAWEAI